MSPEAIAGLRSDLAQTEEDIARREAEVARLQGLALALRRLIVFYDPRSRRARHHARVS